MHSQNNTKWSLKNGINTRLQDLITFDFAWFDSLIKKILYEEKWDLWLIGYLILVRDKTFLKKKKKKKNWKSQSNKITIKIQRFGCLLPLSFFASLIHFAYFQKYLFLIHLFSNMDLSLSYFLKSNCKKKKIWTAVACIIYLFCNIQCFCNLNYRYLNLSFISPVERLSPMLMSII